VRDAARRARVVLTRARGRNDELARRLRAESFAVEVCPLVRTEPVDGPSVRAAEYDWVIVTSRTGAERLFERLEGPLPRIAAIGPGTARALRAHGVEPALVATTSTQEGLVEELPRPTGRVLFAGAEGARRLLVDELGADFVALYRTVEEVPTSFPDADLVVLASASAARAFAALGRPLPCVSIGPVTSEEARRLGLEVVAEAETHDVDGLVRAVKLAGSAIASSRS
jgi:uroporphyrinogen III methyltransferase/synthase